MSSDDDERWIERDETSARDDDAEAEPIEIPFDRLSAAAQRGVIEEFVTREGTDYGHVEVSLEDKAASVRRQIERGEVVLLFDPKSERVNLVTRRERTRRAG
ncbi:MAG: YheU family protein [Sandaracinaceae bacterium]|nr:YheU family protein [Sandaracinaceae bacterium]